MELHELVKRGNFLFSRAPKRLEVYKMVNGRRNAKEIALKTGKPIRSTLDDLKKMRVMELIRYKKDNNGVVIKKDNSIIYEKNPILQHIPLSYFSSPTKVKKQPKEVKRKKPSKIISPISIPTVNMILEISREGETQLYEFKRAGTEARKISKEICGFANTKLGGLIFYGIENDGKITGSDKTKQEIDQPLRNSIYNTISPSLVIDIIQKEVIGEPVIIIRIKPWNKKDVYHYEGRVYIRKGSNAFPAKPDESKILHAGKYVS